MTQSWPPVRFQLARQGCRRSLALNLFELRKRSRNARKANVAQPVRRGREGMPGLTETYLFRFHIDAIALF